MLWAFTVSMFFVFCYFFLKIIFFEKLFQEYHPSVKQLDPGQTRQNVGPDQGPICLQILSADDTCRQTIKRPYCSIQRG